MEIYCNDDGSVVKYIHDDGSETAIKVVTSSKTITNPLTHKNETITDNSKVCVFISTSVGCPVKCKFCYLTAKKFPFYNLTNNEIISNVNSALQHYFKTYPKARKRYLKLSFMGMGEPFIVNSKRDMLTITKEVTKFVSENKLTAGFDTVDIGTSLPQLSKINYVIENEVAPIIEHYKTLKFNPNSTHKSKVRIFVSVHTFDDTIRNTLIPGSDHKPIKEKIKHLLKLTKTKNIDTIFHQTFLKDINDHHLNKFIEKYNEVCGKHELRILQYNECKDTLCKSATSDFLNSMYDTVNKSVWNVKVQWSPGSEVKAACGMFICKMED